MKRLEHGCAVIGGIHGNGFVGFGCDVDVKEYTKSESLANIDHH